MTAAGRFSSVVLALRLSAAVTGAVIALPDLNEPGTVAATTALAVYCTWRTLRPAPAPGAVGVDGRTLVAELAVALAAVAASGGWDSPYVFTILVGIVLAGFTRGYAGGLAAAGAMVAGLGLAALIIPSARANPETASQVALVYAATGVVSGYARRLLLEAEERQAVFADRVAHLTEANDLLSQLARVAQTLPSSLDLGDTLAGATGHFRQLFDFTSAAILIRDPATDSWQVEASAGLIPPAAAGLRLPTPVARAIETRGAVASELQAGEGLWPDSRSGLYGPLVARGHLVALAVLEHADPGRFGAREAERLDGLAEPLALAIDNALWFERLRTLGAEGERERLARALHDRVGQGLAYLGIELDRISRLPEPGPELVRLRQDVRDLLGEVRETLRQLRTRVTEDAGLASLIGAFLARFTERTGTGVRFADESGGGRLPVPVEQELWRIFQEALSNVERHAGATQVAVAWTLAGRRGRLEITDDGAGFESQGGETKLASGIMGMRERANAIGGRLFLESKPGAGTRVVAEVEVQG